MVELTGFEVLILAMGSLGLGMVMLIRGGNWTIDAAVHIASSMGISPMIVGFTIVAFGTSLPELLVSVNANLSDAPGIAIGNVVGSNIANILFVVGVTGLVATIVAVPRDLVRDLSMMMIVTIAFMFLMYAGIMGTYVGLAMVSILILYSAWQYLLARKGHIIVEEIGDSAFSSHKAAAFSLIAGLVFVALGAEFLVRGAKVSATTMGVPEAVIGLTVIAIGTSLPELSTCLSAIAKKQSDLILGNIIGSNVFNILMIIGVTASIKPIDMSLVALQVVNLDMWIMLGVSVLFTAFLLLYRKIDRVVGAVFFAGYVVYMGTIYYMNF